ncbi:MAG: hypothetical protein ACRD2N_14430 [Vicinamibacterales bacterium]
MSRSRFVVPAVALALVTSLSACASFVGERSIAQLQTNPGRYVDRNVTIEGIVTSAWGIPMVPFKAYRLSDGSGEMLVLSDNTRIPSKGARVRVRGEVEEFAVFGGRSFGLHLREKSLRYR